MVAAFGSHRGAEACLGPIRRPWLFWVPSFAGVAGPWRDKWCKRR